MSKWYHEQKERPRLFAAQQQLTRQRKAFRKLQRQRDIAFHEAGHAVVGLSLGGNLSSATNQPAEDYLGVASMMFFDDLPREDRLIILAAGSAAQRKYTTGSPRGSQMSGTDAQDFYRLLGCRDSRVFTDRAASMVNQHWGAIGKVAREMHDTGRIGGRRIRQLLEAAS